MRPGHFRFVLSSGLASTALAVVAGVSLIPEGSLAQSAARVEAGDFSGRLVAAAIGRTVRTVTYDPAYRVLSYPGGDVPDDRGVCTDVIVRSYRAVGIDLQERVHDDMRRSFASYPRRWGLRRPDTNIDHRRVPNLRVFFARHGKSLPVSDDPGGYKPGDIVTWDVARALGDGENPVAGARQSPGKMKFARTPHIGIVTDKLSPDGKRPLIVHNIGWGTRLEDMLFKFPITGHYRYGPAGS